MIKQIFIEYEMNIGMWHIKIKLFMCRLLLFTYQHDISLWNLHKPFFKMATIAWYTDYQNTYDILYNQNMINSTHLI